ncbi:MAG: CocE/NonD family hydrolase [Candidatus Lokiarchaeota archaeon]|nr:CocE/NonD family hydrolase [Candidatus Lokiarchaeota archaeon]
MRKNVKIVSFTLLIVICGFFIITIPSVNANPDEPIFLEEMVPMRDGVRLYTRIYRPGPGKYPAIITRTPYGIGAPGDAPDPTNLTQWPDDILHGYVYVAQDTRGRYASEGVDRLFYDDGPDGYDAIEWVASQPWCNGKVGIHGGSASGITTYLAAGENPPHLITALSYVASANLYNDVTFDGGAYRQDSLIWTYSQTLSGLSSSHLGTVPDPWNIPAYLGDLYGSLIDLMTHTSLTPGYTALDSATWTNLPLRAGDPSFTALQPFGDEIMSHPNQDEFRNKLNVQDAINIPMIHVAGWYDFFSRPSIDAFVALQDKGNQKLYVAPGTHGGLGLPSDLYYSLYYNWFDYWLQGEDTGIMDEPSVYYYVHGLDEWRWADQWPLGGIEWTNYYLHEDGILNTELSIDSEIPESFIYDPANPVLTRGGRNLGIPAGSFDQRPVETGREDILIYTSDELTDNLEISGPIEVVLSASSNCTDTDFTAKLIDVHPDGNAMLVGDGILRARFRESMSDPDLMSPGMIYEFEINLGDMSHVFMAGHRIQVDISSSNFPKHDRNLNTGGELYTETDEDILIALNTIFHDDEFFSYIVLPIVHQDTNVFEGNLRITTHDDKYKGPAEFHIYDNAVYLSFEGQWEKWNIIRHWEIGKNEIYICRGELGSLVVIKRGSKIIATGRKIIFKT